MKKPLPREGLIVRGPGEQDIPDMGPDVEGHGLPGVPGSDGISGLPRTGGELTDADDEPKPDRLPRQ